MHGIGRSVYLFFSVLLRVRVPETRVLLLSTVSDPMSNWGKELASRIQAMGARGYILHCQDTLASGIKG